MYTIFKLFSTNERSLVGVISGTMLLISGMGCREDQAEAAPTGGSSSNPADMAVLADAEIPTELSGESSGESLTSLLEDQGEAVPAEADPEAVSTASVDVGSTWFQDPACFTKKIEIRPKGVRKVTLTFNNCIGPRINSRTFSGTVVAEASPGSAADLPAGQILENVAIDLDLTFVDGGSYKGSRFQTYQGPGIDQLSTDRTTQRTVTVYCISGSGTNKKGNTYDRYGSDATKGTDCKTFVPTTDSAKVYTLSWKPEPGSFEANGKWFVAVKTAAKDVKWSVEHRNIVKAKGFCGKGEVIVNVLSPVASTLNLVADGDGEIMWAGPRRSGTTMLGCTPAP